jgi:hypothetical protein
MAIEELENALYEEHGFISVAADELPRTPSCAERRSSETDTI